MARASGVLLELGCSTSAKDVARRIPASVLRDALGVCFLFTFKAGFVGSLSGGSGVVVCRGADGRWGPPSSLGVVGGGLGLQIGASASESVLVLNTESAVRGFSGTSQVRLGGDVTVAAGPLGRTAEGAVGVQRRTVSEASLGRGTTTTPTPQKKVVRAGAAIWSYSLASGAFAGVAMTGVYVRGRKDANAEFYGPAYRAWGATPADLVLVTPVAERLRDEAVQRSEALRTLYARLERAEEVSTHKHGAAHALAIAQGEHRKPGAVGGASPATLRRYSEALSTATRPTAKASPSSGGWRAAYEVSRRSRASASRGSSAPSAPIPGAQQQMPPPRPKRTERGAAAAASAAFFATPTPFDDDDDDFDIDQG